MAHSGVFWNDPRNLAIGRFLKPETLTAQSVTAKLLRIYAGKPPADLAERVASIMSRPKGSDTLADQSLDSVADPHFGLGTHPDLIERLWTLMQPCLKIVAGWCTANPLSFIRRPASCSDSRREHWDTPCA